MGLFGKSNDEVQKLKDELKAAKAKIAKLEEELKKAKANGKSKDEKTPEKDDAATKNFNDPFEGLMITVEGGKFKMGSQARDADDDEKPLHEVSLSTFMICKYPVTQGQWKTVMGNNPSRFAGDDNRPVDQVSWEDCQLFIEKLNKLTGKKYRLPTEAEWEFAASGGNRSKGYKYSGSNNIKDVAWYCDNSNNSTHGVGQKLGNELGLYDMSGNVYEWCRDWKGPYEKGFVSNPQGPFSGSCRVLRGGSWSSIASNCRVSDRNSISPSSRSSHYGFRIAL